MLFKQALPLKIRSQLMAKATLLMNKKVTMKINLLTDDEINNISNHLKLVDKKIDQLMNTLKGHESDLLNTSDLCRRFKCDPRTVQNWRDKGTLKYSKPEGSNMIFYKREDVEEFILSNQSKNRNK